MAWGAFAVGLPLSHAERLYAPTVGLIRQATQASADTLFGLPLNRPPAWIGKVASVSGNEITFDTPYLEQSPLQGSPDPHEVFVTNGPLAGRSFPITAHTAGSVTVNPQSIATLELQGIQTGDTFEIVPSWTPGTLFPEGNGMAPSSNLLDPVSTLKTYQRSQPGINRAPNKTYFYYNGGLLPSGWYDNDNLGGGLQDHIPLRSEAFVMVRNATALAETTVIVGEVPRTARTGTVGRVTANQAQDNLIVNPYPAPLTLGTSGLVGSGAVEPTTVSIIDPVDTVKLYTESRGFNPAPNKTYFYYNGGLLPSGWYDNDNLGGGLQDNIALPEGAPIVIRKREGPTVSNPWRPSLPYAP